MTGMLLEIAFNLMEYRIFILLLQYLCAADMNLNRQNQAIGTGIAALSVAATTILWGEDWAYITMYLAVFLTILLFAGRRGNALLRFIPAWFLYLTFTVIPGAMLDTLFPIRASRIGTVLLQVGLDLALYALLILLSRIVQRRGIIVCFGAREAIGSIVLFCFTFIDGQLLALMNRQGHGLAAYCGYAALFAGVYLISAGYYLYSVMDMWRRVSGQMRVRAEMEYMQLRLDALDDLKRDSEQTNRMRHDLNKHLALMRALCDEGRYDEVSEYARQLGAESMRSGVRVPTGNEIVDLIVGQKRKICEENGIEFTFEGLIGSMGEMTAPDICGLFANAYDNAIAACMTHDHAYIRTSVRTMRNYAVVEIVNSVDPSRGRQRASANRSDGTLRPESKGGGHGYGMKIMRQIARKYHGNCTFSRDGKEFKVRIVRLT